MTERPTIPGTPTALRKAVPGTSVVVRDGRPWAEAHAYPLTVALLCYWSRPWSGKALERLAWAVVRAQVRGADPDLDRSE